jgi:hypothetical protein
VRRHLLPPPLLLPVLRIVPDRVVLIAGHQRQDMAWRSLE